MRPDRAKDFEAVDIGHHEIEDHRVRGRRLDGRERLPSVPRDVHAVPLAREDVLELDDRGLAVLDDENPPVAACRRRRAAGKELSAADR